MHCHDHGTVLTGQKVLSIPAMISSYILKNNQVGKLKGLQEDFHLGFREIFQVNSSTFYPFVFCQTLPRYEKLLPLDTDY